MSEPHNLLQRLGDAGIDFVVVGLFGRKVKVIGIEQLIKAKEVMGRQKDLLAATELRAIAARRDLEP